MTQILLRYLLRSAAVLLPLAAIIAWIAAGSEAAFGVLVGGVFAALDGAGLIYLVGQLLEPNATRSKGLLFAILFGKLILVAFALWAALTWFNVSGLGIVIGVGVALASLVYGVNRGSSSKEGQAAMAADEARIAQELADNDAESS